MTKLEELKSLKTKEEVTEWLLDFSEDVCSTMALSTEVEEYLESDSQDKYMENEYVNNRKSLSDRRRTECREKKRQKRISNICGWFHGFFPIDKDGYWTDNEDEIVRYKRYDSPHRRTKFLKRQSNKAIRNMDVDEDVALKGGDYKKVFDYQWELH